MKNLITFLFLLLINLSFSQEIPLNIVDRINDVKFIFEGKVINSKPYYAYGGSYIYTSNTVEITKILKGNIKCGTIEVITEGGEIANERLDISHSLKLGKGSSGIFLCTETNKPHSIIDFYPETNSEVLEATFETQSFIRYWGDGHNIEAGDIWQNYDSLAKVYNAVEVISGLKFIDCETKIMKIKPKTNFSNFEEEFPTYKKEDFNKLVNYSKFKKDNYTRSKFSKVITKSSKNTAKVFYNLSNIIITGRTQKYLEFDVTIKDNLGTKYLDQSAIRLKYDTNAFGKNIVDVGGIIVTRGTLNSDSNCYSSPIPSDVNSNTILIPALEKTFSQCKVRILQTAQSIMHIKMKIKTCNIPNNIALVDTATLFFGPSLILSYSAYADFPNDTFQTYYDELEHNQIESVPACKAILKDFWPKKIAGGIKDTLTIYGTKFGATRGNGNLYFKNANDGGKSEVFLDSLDYILWSDTLIKIFVPSYNSSIKNNIASYGLPTGTGFFRIVTDNGDIDTSHTELKIIFSVKNNKHKKTAIISPRSLFNQSFTFHCSNAVANYKGGIIKAVIKKAITDWICLTGINWKLGNDITFNDTIAKSDSICKITFAKLKTHTLASTSSRSKTCGKNNAYFELDIRIDTNKSFYFDTTDNTIPTGYYDFYSIILHELGHAHALRHVIKNSSIMHYSIRSGTKKRDLKHDLSSNEGGNWIIDFSTDTINNLINACGVKNIKTNLFLPCHTVSVKEFANNLSNITLFPNPFTENLNISFNTINNEKIEIRLFDIRGELILSKDYYISTENNSIRINTANLSGGIYVINIRNSEILQNFKLIKYEN